MRCQESCCKKSHPLVFQCTFFESFNFLLIDLKFIQAQPIRLGVEKVDADLIIFRSVSNLTLVGLVFLTMHREENHWTSMAALKILSAVEK